MFFLFSEISFSFVYNAQICLSAAQFYKKLAALADGCYGKVRRRGALKAAWLIVDGALGKLDRTDQVEFSWFIVII